MPVTEYTWDPVTDSILEETDGAGNLLASYTNEPSAYGPLVSQHHDGESRYFHFDALGSTRELTNEDEDVTDTLSNDACGSVAVRTGETETPFQWVGRLGYLHVDGASCQYYVRRRVYIPNISLWMTTDPLEGTHLNGFLYADLSPTLQSDPSGLLTLTTRPSPLRGEQWIDDPRLPVRARTVYNPPTEPEEQIKCECVACPCNPNLKSLECTMILDTNIKINVRTVSEPRGSIRWNYVMRFRYGHEQAHQAWLYRRFREKATEVAALERQYRCVDDCDPNIIRLIVEEWRAARQYSNDHKHAPWNGDDSRTVGIFCIPIGNQMPNVGGYSGPYYVETFQVNE